MVIGDSEEEVRGEVEVLNFFDLYPTVQFEITPAIILSLRCCELAWTEKI